MKTHLSHLKKRAHGSLLIIVLWIAFGLCSVALYYAHSMSMELKAADNQVAGMEADQAIEGAAVYVSNVLATLAVSNRIPDPSGFRASGVKVGNATFWLIGRDTNDLPSSATGDQPVWGLVDECSKLNLNTATAAMGQNLPQMTENLAAAMFDWSSSNSTPSAGGAKSETYSALNPPYNCKNGRYETIDELRMVYGMNLDLLYGEDANLNGILDPNENDGVRNPPADNQDGVLDPGLFEYVTVYSTGEPTVGSNGIPRILVNSPQLTQFIQTNFPSIYPKLANRFGNAPPTWTSVLGFYLANPNLTEADFQQLEPYLMNTNTVGLINVNTATATALSCIPGIGPNLAPQVLAYRQSNPPLNPSVSWLKSALGNNTTVITQAGPYVTGGSWHYSADVAAVGHNGRGYRRVRFVFDCSSGTPLIAYRQDLTHLGWALGKKLHDQLLAGTQ